MGVCCSETRRWASLDEDAFVDELGSMARGWREAADVGVARGGRGDSVTSRTRGWTSAGTRDSIGLVRKP